MDKSKTHVAMSRNFNSDKSTKKKLRTQSKAFRRTVTSDMA